MSRPPGIELRRGEEIRIELLRAEDGGAPRLPTAVTLADDGERLCVEFHCDDPEPWATMGGRDEPLWEEEVVELFAAPGDATPRRYVELEVNPLGAVFDAVVDSPRGDRGGMRVDAAWDCPGLAAQTVVDAARWRASLAVPWRSLALGAEPPLRWRLNFFRIERSRPGSLARAVEHSAWSPTWVSPADFHRPARFGFVTRIE